MFAAKAPVEIFTDGACHRNPGPGGWGVLLRAEGVEQELWGGEADTTNNRMELLAAIKALEALAQPSQVALTTDSEYLRGGITDWIEKWKLRGWRTSDKKPVKNQDLWMRLDHLAQLHQVEWRWVKGHSGHVGNERADALANRGIDEQQAGGL